MKKIILALIVSISSLLAGEINLAVAANVSYAMDELKAEFAKMHPSTKVEVTLGSSGKLTAQINNGAPFGLFMSANMKYPQALYKEGMATTKPIVYAQGALAYFSTKKQDFSQGIKLLESKDIQKIAVANPKTAPYGKAAMEAMKNGSVFDSVKDKFVYAESISQTVAYSISAADIGFIAKSSLYSPKMARYKEGVNFKDVDADLYTPIKQGIVLLKFANGNKEYREFYDFILSAKAKEIFKKYGYLVQ
ncbi:molybdate ABC transporter substrate-binding protein [Sulfurimonas sp. HSL-1716]|uniref:molybdate ABC transporter substrate-binding protein n=1 Tax=Hydrocurvibacter sulfurireducens TaxID=3131937 RepID=UPI0031F815C4